MKKIVYLIALTIVTMVFSSCSQQNDDESMSVDGLIISEITQQDILGETTMEHDYKIDIQNIRSAKIGNSVENMYYTDVDIDVSDEYLSKIKKIYQNLSFSTDLKFRFPLYSIYLFDNDNKLIDKWDVDTYRKIITLDETMISREGEVDEFLTALEEEYGVGYNLLEQIPGDSYYSLLNNLSNGFLRKQVKDNFDDSIDYEIPEEDLRQLMENWEGIEISQEKSDYILVYTINLFNSDGNGLYTFHVDSNNNIYTSTGYQLQGDFILEWIERVLKKGL